ncbi:outer membrane lipoprotein carrier protein LolA [Roseomonas sp. M0104]|uniref:Outer membrane lipoprotein carrier protein LolA n=1 Tax=Teichococcus coralli TaxID=2545983 RepID=A0A845BD11_9PROT|nr:outer membrane lipoprotein carrier protein LolA [Pseudoroseomonas coralli]MXP65483.1 outer membrane lipoprotein carrier protein LolA [Pseudoroseomonas coralli]
MFRRTLLAAAATLPFLPHGAAAQSPQRAALLARIEAYLNSITTMRAHFLQIAQNGGVAEGTAFIARPGRMRFDYEPPEPLLLVASDGQFLYYDRELKQPTVVPVGSTPLGLLLRTQIHFGGDVEVMAVERSGGFVGVTLRRRDAPAEGRLTLIFAEEPLELRQWIVVDSQGRQTRVSLSAIETGMKLDKLLFTFNDPRFFEQEGNR